MMENYVVVTVIKVKKKLQRALLALENTVLRPELVAS
jgi:hypothetical protein